MSKTLSILSALVVIAAISLYLIFTRIASSSPLAISSCATCKNIVFIVIDTLRADHLSSYGYERDTSPFLKSVGDRGVVFEKVFAGSSHTAPATATIFTSLFPSQHGVITGFQITKKLQKQGVAIELKRIPKDVITLGELMKQAGFATLAAADNLNIGKEMGFDRGFDHFEKFDDQGAENLNQAASKFIDGLTPGAPYFAYLHYMDPHAPYHRKEPFFASNCKSIPKGKLRTICAYDSEIKYTDDHMKALFDKYSWLENSLVIITADHGEEFFEHGNAGHGKTLYTEVIHVPLIIYYPGIVSDRVKDNISTVDILPTLAHFTEQKILPLWQGTSLSQYLVDNQPLSQAAPLIASELISATDPLKPRFRSAVEGDWHLIEKGGFESLKDGEKISFESFELFNLKQDFIEEHNVLAENQNVTSRLSARLKTLSQGNYSSGEEVSIPADRKLIDKLKTLGYAD